MNQQSYVHIRLRRDTAQNWTNNNPVLKIGEPGLETDTRKLKFGDGTTAWNNLPYSGVDVNDNLLLENIDDRVANLIKAGSNISINYNDNSNELIISATGLQLSGDYATLVNGKIPAIQLPSYVDDVLEFNNLASFPSSGEGDKIYVTKDSNKTYRWSGSTYIEISASPGSTDAVPEGSVNKYYTDARASAASPVQSVAGKTGVVTLTKNDVGLDNVDNTSDANKPVSTAQQTALDLKAPIANPTFTGTVNGITKGMVGLGNVDNTSDANKPISTATQTALNGKASLVDGKVPAAQLPSYVDDVLEYANLASLPVTGESGKIYVALDSNKVYRWGGSSYLEISPSPGSTDSVAEGSTNLYFTNSRASAAAPVQSVAGKIGTVILSKGDVELSNVDNTSDIDKPVSSATQTALNAKANKTDIYNAAVPWTANHTLADGTRYLAGDLVYVDGKIYRAKFDNESLTVTNTTYWEDLGSGYRLNIDGRDIPNIPYPVTSVNGLIGAVTIDSAGSSIKLGTIMALS